MALATTGDGIRLFCETTGSGTPVFFVHAFGGNHWSWEPHSEKPALFSNALPGFLTRMEAGRWGARDPRADPKQIMRAD
jgi:pimeloyl-ACP methyl ester carboxylesterase